MNPIFPKHLADYLEKIENETNKEIVYFTTQGDTSYFNSQDGKINIYLPTSIVNEIENDNEINEDMQASVAHEATHGLVTFNWGFPELICADANISMEEIEMVRWIQSMVQDVVVNKEIEKNGFNAEREGYLSYIEQLTEYIRNLEITRQDNKISQRNKIFKYITTWTLKKYFSLNKESVKILNEFENLFKAKYPDEYDQARKIIGYFEGENIFSVGGYKTVVEQMLKGWELENKVEFKEWNQ